MSANEYGDRVRKARVSLKMKQKDFGNPLGLTEDDMTNMETGRKKLTAELAVLIEQIHGIDLRWLLTGIGEMFLGKDKPAPAVDGQSAIIECRECHCKMQIALEIQIHNIEISTNRM